MADVSLSRINTNLLVALDLLLHHGNVSRAAVALGVTPSAMSHSLRQLRELLGDPLLVRDGRNMKLSARARELRVPLRRALGAVEAVLRGPDEFDPSTAKRSFFIASKDITAALLGPPLFKILSEEAPQIDVEFRPSRRLDNMRLLADGSLDLVVGVLYPERPEIERSVLYNEHFVCMVRRGHPQISESPDLETFSRWPHILITISEQRTPGYVDQQLEKLGLERFIRMRTRSFWAAYEVLASSDAILSCPYQLARHCERVAPVVILDPPFPNITYPEEQLWHQRVDGDPAHRWLRSAMERAAAEVIDGRELPAVNPLTIATMQTRQLSHDTSG